MWQIEGNSSRKFVSGGAALRELLVEVGALPAPGDAAGAAAAADEGEEDEGQDDDDAGALDLDLFWAGEDTDD